MIARFSAWVNTVNTTAWRIVVSIVLAFEVINLVMVAMLWFRWEPTAMQYKVLLGIDLSVLTMMGFDVAQFIAKRRTETDYVTAKQGPSPVNVEAPSTVKVENGGSDKPAVVEVKPAEVKPPVAVPLIRDD